MRIGQGHGGQCHIAGVFNGICIGDDIPNQRPAGDRGQFIHRDSRVADRGNRGSRIIRHHSSRIIRIRQADSGDIGHATAVDIGLQWIVGARAVDKRAGLQTSGRERIAGQRRDLVIGQGRRTGQGDIASVGDNIGISDGLPGRAEIGQIGSFCHHNSRLNRRAIASQFI